MKTLTPMLHPATRAGGRHATHIPPAQPEPRAERRLLRPGGSLVTLLVLLAALVTALPARVHADTPPWEKWTDFGGPVPGRPVVTLNAGNGLEMFFRGSDNALWHSWQTDLTHASTSWINAQSLGTPSGVVLSGNPAVIKNVDGRLDVFVRGSDSALWHLPMLSNLRDWGTWTKLGGQNGILGDPAVEKNSDGRVEVFARSAADRSLWHIWQTSAGGNWSAWAGLGSPSGLTLLGDPAVGANANGQLEVFARAADNGLWHIKQVYVPFGQSIYGGWANLQGGLAGDPAVGRNVDGRLEVFARFLTTNNLWHRWQTAPDGGWSEWATLYGDLKGEPTVILNAIGRLEVFVRGPGDALWHTWWTGDGSLLWHPWESLVGTFIADQSIGRNADGRLESFVRQSTGWMYHKWQTRTPVNELSISVHDERTQTGGYITVTGKYFSPYSRVRIQFEGIANVQGALSGGYVDAKADGTFSNYAFQATCDRATQGLVTVRVIDVASGQSTTGTTDMFECRQ